VSLYALAVVAFESRRRIRSFTKNYTTIDGRSRLDYNYAQFFTYGGEMGAHLYAGSDEYVVSRPLMEIVNVAIALGKPLLIKGEPGTGKTLLAHSIAKALGKRLIVWNIKSTTKAKDGLYIYDTVQRLNDARFGDKDISDIRRYIRLGKLGQAFVSEEQVVLLIDEIDKADIEFPNDLLNELDEMSFYIPETDELIVAKHRPIVVITSNSEKELPDAFLRRCIFHYIEFPDEAMMERIVRVHFPDIEERLLREAIKKFYMIRAMDSLKKKPSTSELLDWIKALMIGGISPERVASEIPFAGTLLKNEFDVEKIGNLGKGKPAYVRFGS
jgi:MoxR-like ATPase